MLVAAAFQKYRCFHSNITAFLKACVVSATSVSHHVTILSSNNYANVAALSCFGAKPFICLLLTKYETTWRPPAVSGRALNLCPCQTSTLRATFFNSCLLKTWHLPTFHCFILTKIFSPSISCSHKDTCYLSADAADALSICLNIITKCVQIL